MDEASVELEPSGAVKSGSVKSSNGWESTYEVKESVNTTVTVTGRLLDYGSTLDGLSDSESYTVDEKTVVPPPPEKDLIKLFVSVPSGPFTLKENVPITVETIDEDGKKVDPSTLSVTYHDPFDKLDRKISMGREETGKYSGVWDLSELEGIGTFTYKVYVQGSPENSYTGTIEVVSEENKKAIEEEKKKPTGSYREYMERENRPKSAPFPTPEPKTGLEDEEPLYPAIILGFLALLLFPKAEWSKTPRNWLSGRSGWTFTDNKDWLLIGIVGAIIGFFMLQFSGKTGFVSTYLIFGGSSILIGLSEMEKPESFGAFIGTGDRFLQNALFGACFGASYLFFLNWVGNVVGMAVLSVGAYTPIIIVGLLIPVVEEMCFRGFLTPTLAEEMGIYLAIIIGGISFGLAHLVTGGSLFLLVSTTVFGSTMAWLTLRQRSITAPIFAHMMYNSLVFLVPLLT